MISPCTIVFFPAAPSQVRSPLPACISTTLSWIRRGSYIINVEIGFKQGPSFYTTIQFPSLGTHGLLACVREPVTRALHKAWPGDQTGSATVREDRFGSLNTGPPKTAYRLPEQNDSCCCLAAARIRPSSPAGHEGSGGTVNKRGMVTPFEGMMPFPER